MEVEGKITLINPTQTFGAKGFRKREIVVTTQEQYPQPILVEFVQDKCDLIDAYHVGQDVKVSINLRGREWTSPQGETRYFNSIQGWRIEAQAPAAAAQGMPPVPPMEAFTPADNFSDEEQDDLPF